MASESQYTSSRIYGRRQGRPLKGERRDVLGSLLPALSIPLADSSIDPAGLFSFQPEKIVFEIGFGNGEHIAAMMRLRPDDAFIGAEPFINGMSAFLKDIKDDPHDNIRILMDDAILLAEVLTDRSLDEIYILNPDPWPKSRHHKRRIVQTETLDIFARILKPGGLLIMTSDVPDLAEWMYDHTLKHPAFEQDRENKKDVHTAPQNWIPTRYEQKGAKGAARMSYFIFRKK